MSDTTADADKHTRFEQAAIELINLMNSVVEQDLNNLQISPFQQFRAIFQKRLDTLRIYLTPAGDALFVQVPDSRRAYQALVLACEDWRFEHYSTEGKSFRLVIAACERCAEVINQKELTV